MDLVEDDRGQLAFHIQQIGNRIGTLHLGAHLATQESHRVLLHRHAFRQALLKLLGNRLELGAVRAEVGEELQHFRLGAAGLGDHVIVDAFLEFRGGVNHGDHQHGSEEK
ncbi:hypothetical protein D3C80_1569220 [compost metagenome]